jgi:YcxB-like protein
MILKLNYTEALVRKSVWHFCCGTVGWLYPAAFLTVAASLVWLLIGGDRSWVVGVMGTILALSIILPAAVYRNQLEASLAKFRALNGQPASFEGTADGFVVRSAAGSSVLPWSLVTGIWRYDDCWLLLFSKAGFVTLPLEGVSLEALAFVQERVEAHGGHVR